MPFRRPSKIFSAIHASENLSSLLEEFKTGSVGRIPLSPLGAEKKRTFFITAVLLDEFLILEAQRILRLRVPSPDCLLLPNVCKCRRSSPIRLCGGS